MLSDNFEDKATYHCHVTGTWSPWSVLVLLPPEISPPSPHDSAVFSSKTGMPEDRMTHIKHKTEMSKLNSRTAEKQGKEERYFVVTR